MYYLLEVFLELYIRISVCWSRTYKIMYSFKVIWKRLVWLPLLGSEVQVSEMVFKKYSYLGVLSGLHRSITDLEYWLKVCPSLNQVTMLYIGSFRLFMKELIANWRFTVPVYLLCRCHLTSKYSYIRRYASL